MMRHTFLALVLVTLLVACDKGADKGPDKGAGKADKGTATANEKPLLLSAEDVHTVRNNALATGPSITGSVQPERRADLRAEVSAVVLQVLKENGDIVRRGDLLVRLDDTAIRDSLSSADAATRASSQAFEQAVRQFERVTTLRKSGMVSTQALDDAETRRTNAQSDLEAAKTRAAQARQQLQRTEARAPFDGIVSDRKVSGGDTAQIGKELVKVIDPSSMRFEGLVSADSIGSVKAGQLVYFQVNGYGDQEFTGKIRRVNPAANATTRQVEVLVDFSDRKQSILAGLYAEGRIETATTDGLTIPATALVRDGDRTAAWRVKDGVLQKVSLEIGERDTRTGDFVLKAGLTEGDRLIRHPSATLKDGRKVELAASPAASTRAAVNETRK